MEEKWDPVLRPLGLLGPPGPPGPSGVLLHVTGSFIVHNI